MDDETRKSYIKILAEKDAQRLKTLADKIGKKVEDCLLDILTLSITTTHEDKGSPSARTDLYFDGDINIVLPGSGNKIDQETFELHQKTVALAMKNRRELIRIFAELFDLKEIIKFL